MLWYRYQINSGDIMSKERVQIIIRVMPDEKETIQQLAKEENKSMNQFIVDRVLSEFEEKEEAAQEEDSNTKTEETEESEASDSMSTSGPVFALLRDQIHAKDKQINKLQVLIDQQQQLSLSDKKENERLRLNIEELESEDVEEEEINEESYTTEEDADTKSAENSVEEAPIKDNKSSKRWWKLWE